MKFLGNLRTYSELVKLGHTMFALPFTLAAVCIAVSQNYALTPEKLFFIVLAFASARSAAMGFNRIADANFDSKNPRTAKRPTCTGEISIAAATVFVLASLAIFIFSAAMINTLCLILSFPAIAVLLGYSYCKRFTRFSHYVLGLALALAPVGAWIAMAGNFDPKILPLGLGLLFHISAFDIFYSFQDAKFDAENGLFSIPSKFGKNGSLAFAGVSMFAAISCFVATCFLWNAEWVFFACTAAAALIYLAAAALFAASGLKKIDLIFLYMNIAVSLLILLGSASLLA